MLTTIQSQIHTQTSEWTPQRDSQLSQEQWGWGLTSVASFSKSSSSEFLPLLWASRSSPPMSRGNPSRPDPRTCPRNTVGEPGQQRGSNYQGWKLLCEDNGPKGGNNKPVYRKYVHYIRCITFGILQILININIKELFTTVEKLFRMYTRMFRCIHIYVHLYMSTY